ncbi:YopX family protein [Aliarcobacter cryaerophilus]|uniref:YopX family protein n=1 Tax=Aliarcobacter cryaerophilus TaxID=28198 RepID=UPI0021B6482F|nr:YopX family protein [Aliarcobacter cryaerophilus]MCT7528767.1 YopX family protein [Aliarcobacter cryaerophilus]
MREIKFKIFDTKQNKFLNKFYCYFGSDEKMEIYNNGRDFDDGIKNENAILLQYTGFKDMNGIEIYEGDICEIKYSKESQKISFCTNGICFVEFKEGSFWLNNRYDRFSVIINNFEKLEVVGNIYENLELLI